MHSSKKIRRVIVTCTICIICVVMLLLPLTPNVAISINPFDSGGCISVALDKSLLMKADKIIIRVDERQYEITDNDMIRKIVSETKVATNTDLRYPNTDRWIDVYCGNILVRSMRWTDNIDTIIVYKSDRFHWIFPSAEGHGIVWPSEDLIAMLNAVLNIC